MQIHWKNWQYWKDIMKIETLDRIFKFIYIWSLIFLVCFVLYMMTVLIISPKKDLKNRGFIFCTKQLVADLGECESGQMKCVFGAFYGDIACNCGVIYDGFANWLKGEQSAPWSNYIFEPVWQEESENPYLSNPEEDMENMALKREFMLQKHQELENIKNRSLKADETVIISDPEVEAEPEISLENTDENSSDFEQNIDDESAIGEIDNGDETAQKIEQMQPQKIKFESDKIASKAKKEVLKQENKNE